MSTLLVSKDESELWPSSKFSLVKKNNLESRRDYNHAYWHQAVRPEDRKKIVRLCCKFLRRKLTLQPGKDAIVCVGLSGLLVAPVVADRLKLGLIVIRKSGELEETASSRRVVGFVKANRAVFIDDLISSGATAHFVAAQLKELNIEFLGTMLYADDWAEYGEGAHSRVKIIKAFDFTEYK